MRNTYAVVVSHADRSGIIQAFGPYDTPDEAEHAKDHLPVTIPAMAHAGIWEVVICTDLESEGVG